MSVEFSEGILESLRQIIDREEITRVLYTYADHLDRGLYDDMARLIFTEDAVEDHGSGRPIGHGWAEIAQARRERHSKTAGSMHVISNVLIEFTSVDEADVQSYIRTYSWLPHDAAEDNPPVDYILTGVFLDHFVRKPDGWRIASRRRRNVGPSALAIGRFPDHLAGTGGSRES